MAIKLRSSHFSFIPVTLPMSFCPGGIVMMIEYMQGGSSILYACLIWCSPNSRADAPFWSISHLHIFGYSIFPLGCKNLSGWWRYRITALACLNPRSYPLTKSYVTKHLMCQEYYFITELGAIGKLCFLVVIWNVMICSTSSCYFAPW